MQFVLALGLDVSKSARLIVVSSSVVQVGLGSGGLVQPCRGPRQLVRVARGRVQTLQQQLQCGGEKAAIASCGKLITHIKRGLRMDKRAAGFSVLVRVRHRGDMLLLS